ncbi:NACHT, LRR and PYD domains-containing protein 14 [Holothuria leucospilota]|uniref:NACHT, LRR and PYD domains-containing protein 14 n=1 Tax=Holothuria leucospilota TaxID=206669 RepID=A0A9Q1CTG5_HOLLE|nr:NACHT, LRR and PYD domains-containing protein 14 [Holothuria leucospilota]
MDRRCAFTFCFVFFSITVAQTDYNCPPLQHLVVGTTGVIICSFQEGFFGVLWYNSTNVLHEEAILTFREGEKSGIGYDAGEFDVFPNGSLVVHNVSRQHERNFTVILLKTTTDPTVRSFVNVLVNAQTFRPFPRIHRCSDESRVCLQRYHEKLELSCYVQDSRLMIPLRWLVRTNVEDINIPSHFTVTNQTSFYTSTITTTNPFVYSSFVALLVCKADDSFGLLERNQSFVLLTKSNLNHTSLNIITIYVETGSRMELLCSLKQILFLIWQVRNQSTENDIPVIYASLMKDAFIYGYDDDYQLEWDGSLAVREVRTKHEGFYSCISGDGLTDNVMMYRVITFVLPVPEYPVIEGCNHEQYCVLTVEAEGRLTCKVKRIRPRVQLDLRKVFDQSSNVIEFYDKQLTTIGTGDGFDVSLTSKYRIKDTSRKRVTIECRVVGTEIKDLDLSSKFDLLFMTVESATPTATAASRGQFNWMMLVGMTIAIIFVLLCVVTFIWVFHKKQDENRPKKKKFKLQESNTKCEMTENEEEILPMLNRSTTPGKKAVLITELKSKYQDLYDAVQPIPYIRDRLYCVDRVFVEGGIKYLAPNDTAGGHGLWKPLDTYQNILKHPGVKSVRRILEGEPGYGKSTLTLQMAYDWCNKIKVSSLGDVDVLILLRLRQLGGVKSIYRAIKQFLLPIDSTLTEQDIKQIIGNSSSVVVVLDGFDEYPHQEFDNKNDVINIIMKKMFQQFEVILTTRSSFLPKDYPSQTKRIKLTGFDDTARDQYIQKAVVGENVEAAEKIKRKLKDNVILSGLCQVPLFFVMFAHMSHESKHFQKFNSVTSFFRYMIACFHSHMKNKMKDENVKKFDLFEIEHQELDKIAFEGLRVKEQQTVWKKEQLCERLGQDFYNQYVSIGILVEEEVFAISDKPSALITEHAQYNTEVRFYHKLFCEWYAAHHLAEYAAKEKVTFNLNDANKPSLPLLQPDIRSNAWNTDPFLSHYDPIDVQFLYRFACGLNPEAGRKIIDYLRKSKEGEIFAILCILEREGSVEGLLEAVRQLCSRKIEIASNHNLLLQRSTIQLLEIASSNEVRGFSLTNSYSVGELPTL